ncbi:hypothetical protein Dsin_029437 [Dipteronia sinensis]|uniref:Protein-export membrane protein SecG n=1 Tax=Dipteronia sinensis TaxID=43782 RepID=A0AAD9ZU27_9ROSI|nr:hypothetical protein Dsin_029437 [Dipteronia sinensis]
MTKPYLAPMKLMKLWVVLVVIVLMLSIVAAKSAGGITRGGGSGRGRTRVIGVGGAGGSHGRSSSASSLGGANAWLILSVVMLYNFLILLQKGYTSVMSNIIDEELAEKRRKKTAVALQAAHAAAAIQVQ